MTALRRTLGVRDADPAAVGSDDTTRLACWMLTAIRPWPEAASEVFQSLVSAHREGQDDRALWRTLRRAAVTLGNDADAQVRAYGQVAEAAAWPLGTAQAGLIEIMHAICQLRAKQAAAATGWTEQDEQEANTVLSTIAEGDGTARPARDQIPELFMIQDPVLEKRFSISLTAANAAFSRFRAEVAAWIDGATL
ncbi:hypothetical protein [Sphingomonas sp. PB1R3]|uniref:hypothetical protein n=1 Tax=Sphingomonas flavida TaxID=3096154 RepID=UPI002FCA12AA